MSLLDVLLGKPLATAEEEGQKIDVPTGVAILGLDGLSSAGYGPEAAMTVLLPLGALGLAYVTPVMLVILGLLLILYFSYRQTIDAYPSGGGSYTVARENLGENFGLMAGAALMLDYVLNVAVGISAGMGALVSAVPALHPYILVLCLVTLGLITLVNLRGLRETGLIFSVPTYLFVATLGGVTLWGIAQAVSSGGHPSPLEVPPPMADATMGSAGLWILLRSFSSGCTAMTGVEAVSNGVNAFREPAQKHAKQTLTAIVVILAFLLGGIAYVAHAFHVSAVDPDGPNYQSVISIMTAAVVGRGVLYYLTMGSVLAVLALSANTSFAGFPRLCRLLAADNFLPHAFANRGRRLEFTQGIVWLSGTAAVLLIAFGGITDRLIPLFAIGAFLAFTLSQAGMVAHWRRVGGPGSGLSLCVNFVGCVATAVALAIILVAKFVEGAWITVLLLPILLWFFRRVHRHYARVVEETALHRPMDISNLRPPVVVVPLQRWSTVSENALRLAMEMSTDVFAMHISADEEETLAIQRQWRECVECSGPLDGPARPHLQIVDSPYRLLFRPLLEYIEQIKRQFPNRTIAIILPELVERNWYEYLLHNHRAMGLKAALLFYGGSQVAVVNLPWYLGQQTPPDVP